MKTLCLTVVLLVPCALAADATDEFTVRIASGEVEIAKDVSEGQRLRDAIAEDGGILLICKRVQLQRDNTSYMVSCSDVLWFTTAAGLEGLAPEARFDLFNDRVLLTGRKGSLVELDLAAESDSVLLTAEKVELRLTRLSSTESPDGAVLNGKTVPPNGKTELPPAGRVAPYATPALAR